MAKIEPKIFDELKTALVSFGDKYFVGEELNRSKLADDLRNYDEALLSKLFEVDFIKNHFIKEVAGQKLFQIEQLEEAILYNDYWDTSYTKYENRIGLASNGKFLGDSQDVVLDFPFKDGVLTASMTKEDNEDGYDDAFLNEVIEKDEIDRLFDKKIFVNSKRFDENGESTVTEFNEDTDNLIIKGNNLLALHAIRDKYAGKVKLIYIDPPYNTGSDSFGYNDSFNHSTWLTFIKNRLQVARELLSKEGAIYVSIDDKEQAYLKVLMDEIFGKENFLTQFNFQVRYAEKSIAEAKVFKPLIEYTLMYAKDATQFKAIQPTVPYTDDKYMWQIQELESGRIEEIAGNKVEIFEKGQWSLKKVEPNMNALKETWISGSIYSKMSYGQVYQSIVEPRVDIDGNGALYKIYGRGDDGLGYRYYTNPKKAGASRGKMFSGMPLERKEQILNGEAVRLLPIINFADFAGDYGNIRHEGGVALNSGKKPEKLLKMLLDYTTSEGDIVLDFFGGSGSTAATAHKMKRQYISIEQMDYIEDKIVTRLNNVIQGDSTGISKDINWQGGGSFVYTELMPKNMGYLQDVIHAKDLEELKSVYERMLSGTDTDEPADISFRADLSKIDWMEGFDENKRLLVKLLDKNGLYYNYSEIDDKNVRDLISDEDYTFNKNFYEGGD
ncbi:site-specific DNA-methyltransferase [Streptococcus thermophilus]|uniref:DNA methyltransferase n=1 Tax=Streptococcus thermophilus TaxID=1308 RepID=UPI00114404B7|nr:site-specific DNA-methyltransferase [Streptococcus thermophilus]MDI3551919.1 site-specific DNA-methyltransferase [Streptococcus thermophilus]GEB92902.1 hypothetical protein STH02_09320 [Streptococcus thermophilus]